MDAMLDDMRKLSRLQDIAWAVAALVVAGIVVATVIRFGFSVDLLIFLPFVFGGSAFYVWMARGDVRRREAAWQGELDDMSEELERERRRGDELTAELDTLRRQLRS